MKENYLNYYQPLVKQFCEELEKQDLSGLEHMPQPFLPLFGPNYETARLKFMIMGQDTRGWGNCMNYLKKELATPASELADIFNEIEDHNFTQWGKSTNSFWGFAMALLSEIHGISDWRTMKWGQHGEILSSFAWANCNTVELWQSVRKHTSKVPRETWNAVNKAGAHLSKLKHTLETTKPDVILLTCWSNVPSDFYEGLELEKVDCKYDYLDHYIVKGHGTHILHTYHPGYMRNKGGPWGFLNEIRLYLKELGLAPEFPEFICDNEQSESVTEGLYDGFRRVYPDESNQPDKYTAVRWLSEELEKHQAFMAVPTMTTLINRLGYRTNYGTEYSGKRGSYRLVRAAYYRFVDQEPETANRIARVFRKPDFSYAY